MTTAPNLPTPKLYMGMHFVASEMLHKTKLFSKTTVQQEEKM